MPLYLTSVLYLSQATWHSRVVGPSKNESDVHESVIKRCFAIARLYIWGPVRDSTPRPQVRREMSANEALRRQLDELRLEKQALEVENVDGAKLLAVEKDKEEQACTIENLTEENGNLKSLYEELLWDNQARQQAEPRQEYEREQEVRRCSELEEELQREKERAELTCHHAVVEERRKWEEREMRWARQLQLVEEQLKVQGSNNREV